MIEKSFTSFGLILNHLKIKKDVKMKKNQKDIIRMKNKPTKNLYKYMLKHG